MISKKQIIIFLPLVCLFIFFAFFIIFYSFTGSTNRTSEEIPTPTSVQLQPSMTQPTQAQSNPPVEYDQSSQEKLLNNVENRQAISTDDETAKKKMLSLLPAGEDSGTLYRTATFSIDYLSGPNIFQVEILTTNFSQAKVDAVNWFKSQGFSQNAICTYPVQFYLNFEVANQLREKNTIFNPLAEGC